MLGEIDMGEIVDVDEDDEEVTHPLGTWADSFLPYFSLKTKTAETLIQKLRGQR